jgi:hypothetical protein
MKNILSDQRSSLTPKHAQLVALTALAVIAAGVLMGLGALDLYEAANGWVLQA